MEPFLIIFSGLPGSGKSTTSKKLEERLGYKAFTPMQIRREWGYTRYNSNQTNDVALELHRRTEEQLRENKGAIVDSTLVKSKSRQSLYIIADKYDVEAIVIECVCSEKTAKRRMRQRPKNDGLAQEPKTSKVYDKFKANRQLIEDDYKDREFPHVSHIRYNTETNQLEEMRVTEKARHLVELVKQLLNYVGEK